MTEQTSICEKVWQSTTHVWRSVSNIFGPHLDACAVCVFLREHQYGSALTLCFFISGVTLPINPSACAFSTSPLEGIQNTNDERWVKSCMRKMVNQIYKGSFFNSAIVICILQEAANHTQPFKQSGIKCDHKRVRPGYFCSTADRFRPPHSLGQNSTG